MITYHQIRQMTVKIAEQAEYVRELRETLERIHALSDKLSDVGEELEERRQAMSREMQSVELLDDVLRRYVFAAPEIRTDAESETTRPGERRPVDPETGQPIVPPQSQPHGQDVR